MDKYHDIIGIFLSGSINDYCASVACLSCKGLYLPEFSLINRYVLTFNTVGYSVCLGEKSAAFMFHLVTILP